MELKKKTFSKKFVLCLVLILCLSSLYLFVTATGFAPAVDSPKTMALYYQMNNGTGENDTYIKDFSSSSNNGTVYKYPNATFVPNTGYNESGSFSIAPNGYIDCGAPSSLEIADNLSIFAWVKINNYASGHIINKYEGGDGKRKYVLSSAGGKINLVLGNQDGKTSQVSITSTTNLTDGVWYHIGFTFNSTLGKTYLYINGVPEASGNKNTFINNTVSTKTYIGSQAGGFNFFNGSIDEVIIYNDYLTPQEVEDLYNDYVGCNPTSGAINCSLNCKFSDNYFISENLTMSGTGVVTLNGNFTFNGTNQYIFQNQGCEFRINRGGSING